MDDGDALPFDAGDGPSRADRELFYASLALLLDNWDLAQWAVCHVNAWSPEMRGLKMVDELEALLQRDAVGVSSLSVTFVSASGEDNKGATMWAFTKAAPTAANTVGFIVPINDPAGIWETQLSIYQGTQPDNFRYCMLLQVGHNILHEMIHVIGDAYGGGDLPRRPQAGYPDYPTGAFHEDKKIDSGDPPCWDECRMIGTMFVWAMSQRYPCLRESSSTTSPCVNSSSALAFAYSGRGPQNFG